MKPKLILLLSIILTGNLAGQEHQVRIEFNLNRRASVEEYQDELRGKLSRILNEVMGTSEEEIATHSVEPIEATSKVPAGHYSQWQQPIRCNYRVSSRYGYRICPRTRRRRFHKGVDLACSRYSAVYSIAPGKVAHTGYSSSYGYYIIVDHFNGYRSLYAHLSRITVLEGETLSSTKKIGLVGATGHATGSHLHIEVINKGKRINPEKLIRL